MTAKEAISVSSLLLGAVQFVVDNNQPLDTEIDMRRVGQAHSAAMAELAVHMRSHNLNMPAAVPVVSSQAEEEQYAEEGSER